MHESRGLGDVYKRQLKMKADITGTVTPAHPDLWQLAYNRGGKHKALGPNPALHLVLPGPAPCSPELLTPS